MKNIMLFEEFLNELRSYPDYNLKISGFEGLENFIEKYKDEKETLFIHFTNENTITSIINIKHQYGFSPIGFYLFPLYNPINEYKNITNIQNIQTEVIIDTIEKTEKNILTLIKIMDEDFNYFNSLYIYNITKPYYREIDDKYYKKYEDNEPIEVLKEEFYNHLLKITLYKKFYIDDYKHYLNTVFLKENKLDGIKYLKSKGLKFKTKKHFKNLEFIFDDNFSNRKNIILIKLKSLNNILIPEKLTNEEFNKLKNDVFYYLFENGLNLDTKYTNFNEFIDLYKFLCNNLSDKYKDRLKLISINTIFRKLGYKGILTYNQKYLDNLIPNQLVIFDSYNLIEDIKIYKNDLN